MATPQQLESALVISLRDAIKWESSQQGEPPAVNPALPVDPTVYQMRDRALAFRDLIVGAAVIEASIQVSDVYNYRAIHPQLESAVFPELSFYGTNTGQVNSQVRQVVNASIPWDAARFADCDLYGRDTLSYEILSRACQQAFLENPIADIDATGTHIPNTSAWSLAEGAPIQADVNSALPLDKNLFKLPDQNLADRDNQMAGYVAQLVQKLKNPFQHALRLYVQIVTNGQIEREPEVYALTSDDGFNRVFQAEPALSNANQIVYSLSKKTLHWSRELVDEIHVPQIYALAIPGVIPNQIVQILPEVPEQKDAQYWRTKAEQILPNGQSVTDLGRIDITYSGEIEGGQPQLPAASLTAPGGLTAALPFASTGTNRVNLLINPCSVVEIAGADNNSSTGGVNGGVDWAVNIQSGGIADRIYYVDGGDGVIYDNSTYLAGNLFAGSSMIPTYAQAGLIPSGVRQAVVSWNLALPPGTWSLQIEYADLSGNNTGMGVRADYVPLGQAPTQIAKDVTPLQTSGPAGHLSLTPENFFNVGSARPFSLSLYWTYGSGQLHVRRLIFKTKQPTSADFILNGTFGGIQSIASFTALQNQTEVVRLDFAGSVANGELLLSSDNVPIPLRLLALDSQDIGTYAATPLSAAFQGWRQECLERAEKVIQQGYNQTLTAYASAGSAIPSFRDNGSNWSNSATEQWMSFVEIANPRVREVKNVYAIAPDRQYQATVPTIYNGGSYAAGNKFYGVAGVETASQPVTQVGAFIKSTPGHLGRACLVPHGVYFYNGTDTPSGTGVAKAYWDTPLSAPVVVACQPWMIQCGFYTGFPMPDEIGPALPIENIGFGFEPGLIRVTPNPLYFDGITPFGEIRSSAWTVLNIGDVPVNGSASINMSNFSLTGPTGYSLGIGESTTVNVEYLSLGSGSIWTESALATFTGGLGASSLVFATGSLPVIVLPTGTICVDYAQSLRPYFEGTPTFEVVAQGFPKSLFLVDGTVVGVPVQSNIPGVLTFQGTGSQVPGGTYPYFGHTTVIPMDFGTAFGTNTINSITINQNGAFVSSTTSPAYAEVQVPVVYPVPSPNKTGQTSVADLAWTYSSGGAGLGGGFIYLGEGALYALGGWTTRPYPPSNLPICVAVGDWTYAKAKIRSCDSTSTRLSPAYEIVVECTSGFGGQDCTDEFIPVSHPTCGLCISDSTGILAGDGALNHLGAINVTATIPVFSEDNEITISFGAVGGSLLDVSVHIYPLFPP